MQCKLEATKYTNYQIFGRIIKICHGKKPSFLVTIDNDKEDSAFAFRTESSVLLS